MSVRQQLITARLNPFEIRGGLKLKTGAVNAKPPSVLIPLKSGVA